MGRKVLVVEDDVSIRQSLVELLGDEGYDVVGAANGLEALSLLQQPGPPPAVIVLDVMMPVMDGRTFRQEQLRNPRLADIPVIVLSAYRDVAGLASELRATEVIRKPLRLVDLLNVVQRACGASC